MPTRNYSDGSSAFQSLQALSDVTIVLDDNSASPFPFQDQCTDYIAVRNRQAWNAPANLTLLLFRAFLLGCEWVVALDDDIIPAATFSTRGDVDEVVQFMRSKKLDICRFPLRDLWNSLDTVRVDGIWSHKSFPVVYRNWFFYEGLTFKSPELRLHTAAFPASHRARTFNHPDHRVYHTGCFTPSMRESRVAKYRREDPDNRFQRDYSYMLNDQGLELDEVPEADARLIREKCEISAGGNLGQNF